MLTGLDSRSTGRTNLRIRPFYMQVSMGDIVLHISNTMVMPVQAPVYMWMILKDIEYSTNY